MSQTDGKRCLLIDEDQREILRGQLATGTSYRLIVSGEFGPSEISNFIRLLQVQRAVLLDPPPPTMLEDGYAEKD